MARYRSILALILAFVATFVVSCSSPTAQTKAPTYTPAQLEQLQGSVSGIVGLRDRLPELATLIENRDWNNVESFIHGPLGELRVKMNTLLRNLLPDAQAKALATSKEVFGHLNKIDQAAQESSYERAIRNYGGALKDLDAFLQLVPKA
ncbi:MAG: hypothetical protein NVS2B14_15140 [Chamaesiphon sp.]